MIISHSPKIFSQGRLLSFLSVTLPVLVGASAFRRDADLYFSTDRQLKNWSKRNPEEAKVATVNYHWISLKCARELIKNSKKKPKVRCQECGKVR